MVLEINPGLADSRPRPSPRDSMVAPGDTGGPRAPHCPRFPPHPVGYFIRPRVSLGSLCLPPSHPAQACPTEALLRALLVYHFPAPLRQVAPPTPHQGSPQWGGLWGPVQWVSAHPKPSLWQEPHSSLRLCLLLLEPPLEPASLLRGASPRGSAARGGFRVQ